MKKKTDTESSPDATRRMSEPMINESGNDTSITAIPSASNSQDIMTNYSSQSITKVLDANISGIKNGSSSRNATRPPNTFQGASFLSRILFLWPYDLIQRGQRLHRPITEMDLPQVLKEDSSNYNLGIIEQLWEYEQKRSSKNKQRPNLHRALLYHYISTMWDTQILAAIVCAAQVCQAIALGYFIQSFSPKTTSGTDPSSLPYIYAAVLVFFGGVVLLTSHTLYFKTWRKGMQYRISAIAIIYAKSLRLPSTSSTVGTYVSSGRVVNLATNDVERFLLACIMINYLWWGPIQAIGVLIAGIYIIGPAFIAGYVLLLIIVALQFILGKSFAFYRSKIARVTDQRVTLISQAISGVRVMKMNGWEMEFLNRILKLRQKEVGRVQKAARLRAWNEVVFFLCNSLVSLIIFCVHVAIGGTLSPRNVFTTMSLINVVQFTLTKYTALGVMGVSEVYVSIQRIQCYLESTEQQQQHRRSISTNSIKGTPKTIEEFSNNVVISMEQVTSYWDTITKTNYTYTNTNTTNDSLNQADASSTNVVEQSTSNSLPIVALDKINLELRRGQLCCIIGPVGAGKSALLLAIAGELPIKKGNVKRYYHSLAYAAQDAWIMNGSVRDNIILDQQYEAPWYETVVASCGLSDDFQQLSYGDQTLVGDRGVQLSGGQRARISLARALYRNADVLVLDDPLSAVDSRVGRLLFYSAILDLAVNRGKCVVLATHQHQFIGDSRCVLISSGGRIACDGSYSDCILASGGTLSYAVQTDDVVTDVASSLQVNSLSTNSDDNNADTTENEKSNNALAMQDSDAQREISESGVVKFSTYKSYYNAMGGIFVVLLLLVLFTCAQVAALLLVIYFGRWAALPADMQRHNFMIPITLGAIVFVLTAIRSLSAFCYWIRASKNLHNQMTRSVLRAKIEFFDTNPLGRILNRFSADVGINDDLLPQTLHDFLGCAFIVLGGVATAFSVLPITLVAFPPLLWYFVRVRNSFLKISRELKRLEGLARSPMFDMLSESLNGIITIRSNNATQYFQRQFQLRHDAHSRAFFQFIAISRWLGFRMDAIMFFLLVLSSFLAVVVEKAAWINVDQAVLGLALSLLLQLGGTFQWTVRQNAEVVNYMVSVERVSGFCNLPSEAELKCHGDDGLNNWPCSGNIDVSNLTVRYRKNLPPSLDGICCKIPGGARVGIVGRTGSGKSTLVQALFRILEPENGTIIIDGKNITALGLHKLRQGLSVIPQTPTLFSGCTVRENLDPFATYMDDEVLSALSDVQMLNVIDMLPGGLDYIVSENGSNFSVGQRQLLCLARAILRKSKILVLDEATANVDYTTDRLLQEAVRRSFNESTILAIAHRLETVIDYDLILVIGRGKVLEYGPPNELLLNPTGHFTSLVNHCDENMVQELHSRSLHSSV